MKQAAILREITRQQAEALRELRDEKRQVLAEMARGPLLTAGQGPPPREFETELAVEKVEIERLNAELAVWRSKGGRPSTDEDRAAERRRAEQAQWKAERVELQSAIEAAKDKAARLMSAMPPKEGRRADPEAAQLEEEAARLRQETVATEKRVASLRREVEAEQTRSRQEASRQTSAVEEEMRLLLRRKEVEQDLKVAQQAQLRSLRDTIVAMRQQISQATRENTELRTALQTNREVLHRLRQ